MSSLTLRSMTYRHLLRDVAPTEFALCLAVSLVAVLSITQVIGPTHALRTAHMSIANISIAMAAADDVHGAGAMMPATVPIAIK